MCLRKRHGPGRAYVYAPKKRAEVLTTLTRSPINPFDILSMSYDVDCFDNPRCAQVAMRMVEEQQAEETFAPQLDPVSKALGQRRLESRTMNASIHWASTRVLEAAASSSSAKGPNGDKDRSSSKGHAASANGKWAQSLASTASATANAIPVDKAVKGDHPSTLIPRAHHSGSFVS